LEKIKKERALMYREEGQGERDNLRKEKNLPIRVEKWGGGLLKSNVIFFRNFKAERVVIDGKGIRTRRGTV